MDKNLGSTNILLIAVTLTTGAGGAWGAEASPEEISIESGRKFDRGALPAAGSAPAGVNLAEDFTHYHYSQGIKETDEENVVSSASLIKHAGAPGHLINAVPPVALVGAGKLWVEASNGERGDHAKFVTRTATVFLPVGVLMLAGLTLAVIVDNLWDAVEDVVMGREGVIDRREPMTL